MLLCGAIHSIKFAKVQWGEPIEWAMGQLFLDVFSSLFTPTHISCIGPSGVYLGQNFIYLQSLSVFFNHDFTWSWTSSASFPSAPLFRALLPFHLNTHRMQQRKQWEKARQTKKWESNDFSNKEIERRTRNISNGPSRGDSFDWKMFKGYEVSTDELSACSSSLPSTEQLSLFFAVLCLLLGVSVAKRKLPGSGDGSLGKWIPERYLERAKVFVALHLWCVLWIHNKEG